MHISSKFAGENLGRKTLARAALFLAIVSVSPSAAFAESAYIDQAPRGGVLSAPLNFNLPASSVPQFSYRSGAPGANPMSPSYQTAVPTNVAHNFAQSFTVGSYNSVAQIQTGVNDNSSVGILGGTDNKVGVLQSGNSLRSNLVLLNTQGMNIGVIQPNGSAPVNVLVARLPNGSLLIKP